MKVVAKAVLAAVIAAASAAAPAGAQTSPGAWPRCLPERDGQRLGLGGSVCECRYERGGSMIGKPPGWRWSCDILKMDESALGAPADGGVGRRGLPPGFTYVPQTGPQSGVPGGVPYPYESWSAPAPYSVPGDIGPRGPAPLLGHSPWR